ncbi:hypothetical protein T265_14492, partial [Opisthorchis viverrini]
MSSDNQTDTIRLSDLKAPTIGCSCFHLPRIKLHTKRIRQFSDSPSQLSLDIIQNGVSANKQVRCNVPKRDNDDVHETAWSDGCVFGNRAESLSELTEDASQVTALKLTVPDSKSQDNAPKQTKRRLKLCAPCTMENKFNASVQIRKAKKLFSVFCWAVLTTAMLSISLTIWILCGTQSFVLAQLPNDTTSLDCKRFITNRDDIVSGGLNNDVTDDVTSIGDEKFAITANRPITKQRTRTIYIPQHLLGYWSVRRDCQLDCKRFITNRDDIVSGGLNNDVTDDVTSIGDEKFAITANRPITKQRTRTIYIPQHLRPPSFLTQFATSWTLVLYPIYLICNVILRFEKASSNELLMQNYESIVFSSRNHMVILASDQPTIVKVLTRCILLSILWQLFLNCFLRSMEVVSPIDCAAIMAVLPCFHYLFSWIIVHRRFCALRVIAFILASSGVIFNIYSDQYSMWYKCLSSVAVVAFALFNVSCPYLSFQRFVLSSALF